MDCKINKIFLITVNFLSYFRFFLILFFLYGCYPYITLPDSLNNPIAKKILFSNSVAPCDLTMLKKEFFYL